MQNTILKYWLIEPSILTQKSKFKYLRYILRYLLNWKAHYSWIEYLNSSKKINTWKKSYGADLYLKIQYPYLDGQFKPQQTLECLTDHYNWLMLHINEKNYLEDEILLWTHRLEIDEKVQNLAIYLKCRAPFIHEGEVALILKLDDQIQYTLSFTYILNNGVPTFFIGGLQGGRPEVTSSEMLKNLTKQLYGLRPKQLMIHVVSAMSEFYKVNALIGVSNDNHAFQRSRRKSKRERVKANLDDFWLNFNATLEQDGNYHFSPISNVINLEEIQSKKRSQYRKRQLVLDAMTQQCKQSLQIISKK